MIQKSMLLKKDFMAPKCKLNAQVVTLKQGLEAGKETLRHKTGLRDRLSFQVVAYKLTTSRSNRQTRHETLPGYCVMEGFSNIAKRQHVGASTLSGHSTLVVKVTPVCDRTTQAVGKPRQLQHRQLLALRQELGRAIHMILRGIWQAPVPDLAVFFRILVGIENPRKVPWLNRSLRQKKQTTCIPQQGKLKALIRLFRTEVGNSFMGNWQAMHEKGGLLERQPQTTIQVISHGPSSFTCQLDSGGVQGTIRQQFRML